MNFHASNIVLQVEANVDLTYDGRLDPSKSAGWYLKESQNVRSCDRYHHIRVYNNRFQPPLGSRGDDSRGFYDFGL